MERRILRFPYHMNCTKNILTEFKRQTVIIKCGECHKTKEISFLQYDKNWGYPKGTEKQSVGEWLHSQEYYEKEGKEMAEKIKIEFRDIENGQTLGSSTIPMTAIQKLKVGDRVEFKDVGAIFGIMEIVSFAVNSGYPNGRIDLKTIKSKGKIKLQEVNDEYVDSLIPF